MEKTDRRLFIMASILGLLAVAIGAYGAHGLKNVLSSNDLPLDRLDIFKTGVSYHFYHTFAIFIALIIPFSQPKLKRISVRLFLIGIILFSGSLYLLPIRELIPIPTFILGPATPIGGLFFMAGWITLMMSIINYKQSPNH